MLDHELNEARREALAGRSNIGLVGLRWAESAPPDWTVTTLQRLFTVSSGDFLSPGDLQEEGFPVFGGNGFRGFFRDTNCDANTMLIGRYGALCGNVHIPPEPFWATEHAFRVRPLVEYHQSFVARYVEALELRHLAARAAQPGLNSRMVREQVIALPDLATQRQIADFLDRETARIDLLIEKKQRLVALLGEREAALRDRLLQISTDDTIEDLERPWLSGYCGDWKIQRLSYYLRSSPCYGVLKPDNYEGADAVPIIRIKDISDGELQLDDIITISPQQSQEYARTVLSTGDVVLSVVGTIGKILTVDKIAAGMNLTRALARAQLSEGLSADFFTLVVGSRWFTEYVTVTTQGSAQKVLNMDDLRAWRFPVPPKAEQTRVCELYREQSASLVAARQRTDASIDRLKEYRSALITAAVTGQIDVSTYAKSGTPDRRLDAIQEEMSA